jgi:hypothetical protein
MNYIEYTARMSVLDFKGINTFNQSPMDQFEIKPFFGEFLGLNYTPVGLFTNILVYIGLVVTFTILFYLYGTFKDSIKING